MTRHHRQRAQTMTVALVAMISILGILSMVVDAGVYFVLKRQLQNAADAAALSAVWYEPACVSTWSSYGCQPTNPRPTAIECTTPPNTCALCDPRPCTAAVDSMKANWAVAEALCAGPNLPTGVNPVAINAHPGSPGYAVTLSCKAPRWFSRVLPGIGVTMDINANATAALGWRGPNGQLVGDPRPTLTTPLVARLIL